ncbi:MAG: hypothetical protein CSB48_05055 [Proteobacteria bacterium]|nr:MAG: hypothetical protein CSB48_05055 [Pseudomonadota bacterium]PIE40274.1 MAG: hypothetical protein CSA51_01705 [Gammaproteobacteria bacterium]
MRPVNTLTAFLIATTLLVGCAGSNTAMVANDAMAADDTAVSVTAPGLAPLDKKGKLDLSGQGFVPGTRIVLIFNSSDGIKSDLTGSLKPSPVVDAYGNWSTTWSYGRLVKKKIIKAGSYKIDIVNEDYDRLASTRVSFGN